ncbi:MAG: hypothetical protein ACXWRA_03445 [Pseudobdellovibrionaceae bacterium]
MQKFITVSLLTSLMSFSSVGFGSNRPWDTKPQGHSFNLNDLNGNYKLADRLYTDSWKLGDPRCPGEDGLVVAVQYNSKAEVREDKMYYVDSVGFWTTGEIHSLISSIEYIDQGSDILSYSNGPSGVTDWLACRLVPLSPDCDRGNEAVDEYYKRTNIKSEDTRVETRAISTGRSIQRAYQAIHKKRFRDHTETEQNNILEVLEQNGPDLTYSHFSQDKLERVCRYKKLN